MLELQQRRKPIMKGSEEKENVGNTKMPPSNHHRPHRIHHNKWANSSIIRFCTKWTNIMKITIKMTSIGRQIVLKYKMQRNVEKSK